MSDKKTVSIPQPSLQRSIFLGVLLIVFDAFVLNQGAISLLVGIWLLFISLPRTFLTKKYVTVRPQRLRTIAIYLTAVILVFALNAMNNRLAQARAETLIEAVKTFHTKNQRYPGSLEELVPDFVDQVPLAKYTLGFNQFWYTTSDSSITLSYIQFPPFGRRAYSFAENAWGYLD